MQADTMPSCQALEAHMWLMAVAVACHCCLVQVSLPTNFTQFLNATVLKGVRIGVFRQIRCGVEVGKQCHPACYTAWGSSASLLVPYDQLECPALD